MNVKCFMLTPTERCRRWLRRYESQPCPRISGDYSYHQALVLGEDAPVIHLSDGCITTQQFRVDDPRWPTHCPCGFLFSDKAARQTFDLEIYLTPDGKEVSIHCQPPPELARAPIGAMWYADWMSWKGPDGRSLVVMTPAGEWGIDGPSSNVGRPWTRTGTPPNVTVNPSIHFVGRYHGRLRNGELSDA